MFKKFKIKIYHSQQTKDLTLRKQCLLNISNSSEPQVVFSFREWVQSLYWMSHSIIESWFSNQSWKLCQIFPEFLLSVKVIFTLLDLGVFSKFSRVCTLGEDSWKVTETSFQDRLREGWRGVPHCARNWSSPLHPPA